MKYFYTYLLPFKPNLQFDYWKVKDADECLGKASSKYGTTNFQIEQTTKACYDDAMGIKRVKLKTIKLTDIQIETLKNLIGDPTKFENMTNKEFVKNGLDNIMEQLQDEE